MIKTDFHIPLLTDRDTVFASVNAVGAKENDAAFASLYLLREKYGTEIALCGGMLLRRYRAGFRAGCFGFPLGSGDLRSALSRLYADASERGETLRLTLLTKEQCDTLEALFPGGFQFTPAEDYTEYLYLRQNLAELKGSKYHGKRNHIAQFWRAYPDAQIQPLIAENADFAVRIAERWLAGRDDPQAPSLLAELRCIREAAAGWDALGLTGLLLYAKADEEPVGMTVLSQISDGIYDVHFEKVVPGYPHAWPVVANEAAKCLKDAVYLNREEDLGEAGMRASKNSYHPDLRNEKFTALWCGRESLIC
ncbi:MAG: DUF2156 domain-containing protein [Oscillospiraceae bacterium]|nr:DUF2156 domain-containing protein [Oscillospiraceae bacterium]